MNHRLSFRTLLAAAIVATVAGVAIAAPAVPPDGSAASPRAKLDRNGDGAIDRSEAATHPRLAEHFDALDHNHDGRLDASERPAHRGRHGGRGGHDAMERIVAADKDGDGRLNRSEAAPLPWLAEHFDEIDRNRDGQVVRSEMRSYRERMRPQHEAERAKRSDERFAAADLNQDGKLSRVEVSEKMPRLLPAFAFMDEDRDGFLRRDDLRHDRH